MSSPYHSDDTDSFLTACSSFSSQGDPSIAETLFSQFSDVPRNFNVVHINAQSIPAHFPEMLASFDCTNLHAILISESWLKPCLPSSAYTLPGFNLIRNDRAVGGGGGVAIYLRTHIPYTVISLSPQPPLSKAGEHIFLEVELQHFKILLGVYYCPSLRVDFFASFELLLEQFTPSYGHAIIMGDFNTCLLKNDSRSTTLQSIIQSCNLSILPTNATHYFPHSTPSLLDLMLVSSPNLAVKHGQCSADEFSYHDLLYLSFRLRPLKSKSKIILQRNFKSIDIEALTEDASAIDWTSLFGAASIDDKVEFFNAKILSLYDKHAPIRKMKVKHLPSPWLTSDIKALIHKKAAAKSRYKKNPSDINRDKYVSIRNHCNKVCRNAQRRYIHSSVENGDPAKVWKFLRSLGVGKSVHDSSSMNLDISLLNQHFSASSNFDIMTKDTTLKRLTSASTPDCSPFFFSQFSDCDVKKSIVSITSNAVGSDCLSRNMILPILDEILPVISHILNHSISHGVFPKAWKDADIIPIPKKKNPGSFSDYRPISILPFLSKVLERLIHSQFSKYLSTNLLLNPFQSGFRPGHSTTTTLVHITEDIRSAMENGELTVLALLDFSNAFNTVDFDVLLCILRSLNISPTAIDWFHNYLHGRRQRINIDSAVSSWCSTNAGVPQGGVLSPLLFSVFINAITTDLTSSYHLYADDLQIYSRAPPIDLVNAVSTINADLDKICKWSISHGLKINPSKTQVIIVGSSRLISKIDMNLLPQVSCDGTLIPFSNKVKNLGIYIDSTFTWDPQLQELSRKMFAAAGSMRRLRNFLPIPTKIALTQSLLFPILDYADASYLDLTENQLNKLERLQNLCIRFIFGLRKYDHVSAYRKKLKWLPIRLRRNAHILSLLYNTLFNPCTPCYLKSRFSFLRDTHPKPLRSSENLKLKMPGHSTKFLDNSFSVQAVRLWNALPVAIRRAQTLTAFKRLVREHYLGDLYEP